MNTLEFTLDVQASLPTIAPFQPNELTENAINSPYPVIKILLRNPPQEDEDQQPITYYEHFKSISLEKVKIHVDVQNLQELLLRNDFSILTSDSAFQPFGDNPKVGSGFYFYNTEVCHKKLDFLSIDIGWMGLPKNFATHYDAYNEILNQINNQTSEEETNNNNQTSEKIINNQSFKVKLKFFSNRYRKGSDIETKKLFQQNINSLEDSVTLSYQNSDTFHGYATDASLVEIDTEDPLEQDRYFKLELESPDFLHDLYPLVLNKVAADSDPPVFSPYTPQYPRSWHYHFRATLLRHHRFKLSSLLRDERLTRISPRRSSYRVHTSRSKLTKGCK